MDRISPTLRPDRTAVMHQRCSELGFLHWPVPVAALADQVNSARPLGLRDVGGS